MVKNSKWEMTSERSGKSCTGKNNKSKLMTDVKSDVPFCMPCIEGMQNSKLTEKL